ncbi:MAG: DNA phosphorothioation-associated protein 4 [Chthoniobacteraceae bacterium]
MRRIQRALDKEELVKELTSGETPCFREIWRLLIFAATLGFKLGRREELGDTDSGKAVPENYFANSTAWPGLLFLFGLVEKNETNLLLAADEADDELAKIFEEYANGGLAYLKSRLATKGSNLLSILDLIAEVTATPPSAPNLKDIGI